MFEQNVGTFGSSLTLVRLRLLSLKPDARSRSTYDVAWSKGDAKLRPYIWTARLLVCELKRLGAAL